MGMKVPPFEHWMRVWTSFSLIMTLTLKLSISIRRVSFTHKQWNKTSRRKREQVKILIAIVHRLLFQMESYCSPNSLILNHKSAEIYHVCRQVERLPCWSGARFLLHFVLVINLLPSPTCPPTRVTNSSTSTRKRTKEANHPFLHNGLFNYLPS